MGRDLSCASFTTFTSISIHAPLWDATKAPVSNSIKDSDFNPRAPVGRDFIFNYCCFFADYISIHAPLWDATPKQIRNSHPYVDFNPRAPVGRDTIHFQKCNNRLVFQSTRPCGTRLMDNVLFSFSSEISIHAPLWDATIS